MFNAKDVVQKYHVKFNYFCCYKPISVANLATQELRDTLTTSSEPEA